MNKQRILRAIFLGCACGSIFFAGYFFDVAHLENKLLSAQFAGKLLQNQLQQVSYQHFQLEEKTIRLPEIKSMLETWQAHFIKRRDMAELLKMITKTGKSDKLQFTYFNVEKTPPSSSYYALVPIKIIAVGKYEQLLKFVNDISQLPWLVVIQDFVAAQLDQENFSMELELDIYHLKKGPL